MDTKEKLGVALIFTMLAAVMLSVIADYVRYGASESATKTYEEHRAEEVWGRFATCLRYTAMTVDTAIQDCRSAAEALTPLRAPPTPASGVPATPVQGRSGAAVGGAGEQSPGGVERGR